ncbi:prolyl oligopeptidase family serine peptidase [Lentimicrobium sp. S6]|uniref:S9 family peptidase n=1 Tax=Lentimicrobium sp. S6 TaxID=2735872 RepID=UPI0015545918|nr:prolyl oligopeptidase family serine peptidase [Lentimicrobium sp. S6]NPD45425.1 S9 family peptidase [Lentimicrobium sp. S6]
MNLRYCLFLIFSLFVLNLSAQNNTELRIENFIVTNPVEVNLPLFADVESIDGKTFEEADLIKYKYLENINFRPEAGDELEWSNFQFLRWNKKVIREVSIKLKPLNKPLQIAYACFYIENTEWTNLEMNFNSGQMMEVFIDGELIKGKYSSEKENDEKEFKVIKDLEANNHVVMIKMLYNSKENEEWTLSCNIIAKNTLNNINLVSSDQAEFYMDIDHLMNGIDIQEAKIAPSGDYYFVKYKIQDGKSESQIITDVRKVADNQSVQLFYGSEVSALQWSPKGSKLSYITKMGQKSWIWEYNFEDGKKYPLATDLSEISYFQWSPNGEFLVLTIMEKPKKDNSGLKQLQGMPDHWPWYRMRSNIYLLDILSGIKTPLTHGYQSNQLQDISPNGRFILFAQNMYDETERPYSKQVMMQYDRRTQKLDTLWNKFGSGNVSYSPNGTQLLITAGPAFFGDLGVNLSESNIPNDYDNQAYIYTLKDKSVEAISRGFNPNILGSNWNASDPDHIYFNVSDRTYMNMYRYSILDKSYDLLTLNCDVVNSTSLAKDKPSLLYYGSSISTPKQLFLYDIVLAKNTLLEYPEQHFFEDIVFGENEDWNFTNAEGVEIEGRIYYPPNFDKDDKYPLIVYYYGGTSPVERNFRGRYPKNLFAANGYIVYVLQPSGATGYGQDFSAMHVNNWGQTVAAEIIKGSKEVCRSHTFIDSTKVGCMGASYGGFMTMYLSTQTDFFAAHISHAGISSISSYWGEGYWGYLYSQVASANNFPWNNKELYVEQSPLFHADKVSSPILLLHGNNDTNVPPGESRQFYTALKLLKKDVELIEIDKQDHHIKDYQKRILWQKTILAYFDKNLKKQSDWWYHLYPKKKY